MATANANPAAPVSPFATPPYWGAGMTGGMVAPGASAPPGTTTASPFGSPQTSTQTASAAPTGQVVYTDPQTGQGYDAASLATAWNGGQGAFATNPLNARVGDILSQYPNASSPTATPVTAAAAQPGATGSSAFGFTPVPGTTPAGLASPQGSAFYNMLLGRIGSVNENVDPNDPTIKNQVEAYSANNTRAQRDYLTAAAEKGGQTPNTDAAARSLAENGAQATGAFQAGLISQERNARRSEIQNLLSQGSSFLTAEQQMQLQQELQQMGLEQNAYEFGQNDAYRYSPFAAGATA